MKTYLKTLWFLILAFAMQAVLAQTWTQRSDFPALGREGAIGFSIGGSIYLGTGRNTDGANEDFWQYDTSTDSWSQKADFGGGLRQYASAFSLGNKGYAGCGSVGNNDPGLDDFWEYDPTNNTWTVRAPVGAGGRLKALGFAIGSKGYIGYGTSDNLLGNISDFWEYDATVDTWTQRADYGDIFLSSGGASFVVGAMGYMIMWDLPGHQHVWRYAPLSDTWIQRADFPGDALIGSAGFAIGNVGFLCGGMNINDADLSDLWAYEPIADSWTRGVDMPGSPCRTALAISTGSTAYFGLGTGTNDAHFTDWWSYSQGICTVGAPCDDGDACTTNDSLTFFCTCAGITGPNNDGDALCDAIDPCPFLPNLSNGLACDDGDPCTINDIVTNCLCAGTFADTDNDGTCDANDPCNNTTDGQTCNDGNPCTTGEFLTNCVCGSGSALPDSDGDGVCDVQDDCPNTPGQNGYPCNDGDPCTVGEILAGCVCGGGISGPDNDGDGICDTQDNDWSQDVNLSTGRTSAVAFSMGGYGYIGTGADASNNLLNDFWRFDPVTSSWTQMADFGGTARYQAAGFSMELATGPFGFIGTGFDPSNTNDFWAYDPAGNTWVQRADFAGTARGAAVGFSTGTSLDTLGFIGTGYGNAPLNDLWAYDPDADSWTQVSSLPTSGRYLATAFSTGSLGYVTTGSLDGAPQQDLWQYDPNTDTWTSLAALPGEARSGAVAFALDGKGYVGTGFGNDLLRDLWRYDPTTDSWARRTDMPGYGRNSAVAFAAGNFGFIGTGYDGFTALNDLWRFTPDGCIVGASCDDGDACTVNDVFDASCTCVGTFTDSDNDGVCDPNDSCPNQAPGPGDVFTDAIVIDEPQESGTTSCYSNAFSTSSAPGSASASDARDVFLALPTTACTEHLSINADLSSEGILHLLDLNGEELAVASGTAPSIVDFPTDPGATYHIVIEATDPQQNLAFALFWSLDEPDADNDGVCDPNDPCPLLANLANGNACDDGNACTINDVVANCACTGTTSPDADNDGLCDATDPCPLLANLVNGNTCDDGNACTMNDVVANCACAGTTSPDSDGDGSCDAIDNCPNTTGQIGAPCTDNNANTINDTVNGACVCVGTPVIVCTNDLELVFQSDGTSIIAWALHEQGSGVVVQSGGGQYPASPNYLVTTCLPNGDYYLVVSDDGCNGITNGGYILRTVSGAMLIDDRNNFLGGCTSQIAGGEGFTLPVGTDRLIYTSCDKLDWRNNEYIVASDNAAVTAVWNSFPSGSTQRATSGYEMWWYNPNGGYTFRRFQSHTTNNGMTANAIRACHFKINSWSSNQLLNGVLYNVKVRSRAIGANASWGPACRFVLDPVRAQCPLTHLMDMPGNQYLSCGATRAVGSGAANLVHARVATRVINNVSTNANKYQFRFRIVNEGVSIVKTSNAGQYWVNTTGLTACKEYEVDVRASFDNGATYCNTFAASNPYAPSWGRLCTLNTSGCPSGNGGGQNMAVDGSSFGSAQDGSPRQLVLYPNPNNGEQLFLSIDQVKEGVSTVSVDILDTFGKRVSTSRIAVNEGHVTTVIDLKGELATGMYVVSITAGEDTYTERLVIQP